MGTLPYNISFASFASIVMNSRYFCFRQPFNILDPSNPCLLASSVIEWSHETMYCGWLF